MNKKALHQITIIQIIVLTLLATALFAQQPDTLPSIEEIRKKVPEQEYPAIILANGDTSYYLPDSPVVQALDSALYVKFYQNKYFYSDTTGMVQSRFNQKDIPTYPDSVYEKRIEDLNIQSPIELTYNKEVKAFINLYIFFFSSSRPIKRKNLSLRLIPSLSKSSLSNSAGWFIGLNSCPW